MNGSLGSVASKGSPSEATGTLGMASYARNGGATSVREQGWRAIESADQVVAASRSRIEVTLPLSGFVGTQSGTGRGTSLANDSVLTFFGFFDLSDSGVGLSLGLSRQGEARTSSCPAAG